MGCVQSHSKENGVRVDKPVQTYHSALAPGSQPSFDFKDGGVGCAAQPSVSPESVKPVISIAPYDGPQSVTIPQFSSLLSSGSAHSGHSEPLTPLMQEFQPVRRISSDLAPVVDRSGILTPSFSKQLSRLSACSVMSDAGSTLIDADDPKPIRLTKLIGKGGCGKVYLGEWDGKEVAVKAIRIYGAGFHQEGEELSFESEMDQRRERIAQLEAVVMSLVHHANIVQTFKICSCIHGAALSHRNPSSTKGTKEDGGSAAAYVQVGDDLLYQWYIVMEHCRLGSLWHALCKNLIHLPADPEQLLVGWDAWAALETLKEVVDALMYLHLNGVVHGDLKAANVLLAHSNTDRRGFISKVCDFGFSRIMHGQHPRIFTKTYGTVTHMPPELLADGVLSMATDVYAFGILMWEVYVAKAPMKDLSDSEVIVAVVDDKLRPVFPPDVHPRYKFLAERCWSEMPKDRPSLQTVRQELVALQQEMCPDGPDSPCIVILGQRRQQRRISMPTQAMLATLAPAPPPPVPTAAVRFLANRRASAADASMIATADAAAAAAAGIPYPTTSAFLPSQESLYIVDPKGMQLQRVMPHSPLRPYTHGVTVRSCATSGNGSPLPASKAASSNGAPSTSTSQHLSILSSMQFVMQQQQQLMQQPQEQLQLQLQPQGTRQPEPFSKPGEPPSSPAVKGAQGHVRPPSPGFQRESSGLFGPLLHIVDEH